MRVGFTADDLNKNKANKYTLDIYAFLGVRNVAQSRRQPTGALHEAINIDIDDEGGVLSRTGYIPYLTLTNVTAAFTPFDHQSAYLVDNGTLKRIYPNEVVSIASGMPSTPIYWAEAGDRVFMSSGHMVYNNSLISMIVPPPDAPQIVVTGGKLLEGWYQVIITRMMADGRESGSSTSTLLDVPANGGIQLSGVTGCNVYVTAPDGDIFYFAGYQTTNVTNDTSALSLPIHEDLITANPLPDDMGPIAYYESSLYFSTYDQSAHTSMVGWSYPFRWHVTDASGNFFQVPGEVRMLVAHEDNLVIGTDTQILSYNGEGLTKLAAYGVPKGHVYSMTRDRKIFFQSNRGVCTLPFENLTMDKVALPVDHCATALVDMEGFEKFITLTGGTGRTDNSTI